ncbi:MAG: hypothetical protein ABI629_22080 [bacterium]
MRRGRDWSALLCAAIACLGLSGAAHAAPTPLIWHYACGGDDPPWRLEIAGSSAQLSRPTSSGAAAQELSGAMQRLGHLQPAWVMWRGHTRAGAYTLVATLREEECRATAAAPIGAYRILTSFPDGSVGSGCCQAEQRLNVRAAAAARYASKPADDWSRTLPEWRPAIAACAANADRPVDMVSHVGPAAEGGVVVRLVAADGSRIDCSIDAAATQPVSLVAVAADAAALSGEALPLYFLRTDPPPQRSCGRLERVLGARNAALGYLYYPDGCGATAR